MRIEIKGIPLAQKRARFTSIGKFGRIYDPMKYQKDFIKLEIARQVKLALKSENKEIALEASNLASAESLIISMEFHIPPSISLPERKRNAKLWGLERHIQKPDLDNLVKLYQDCCSGIVFKDDMNIFILKCTKRFDFNPRIVIDIKSRDQMRLNNDAVGILELYGPDQLQELVHSAQQLLEVYEMYKLDQTNDPENEETIQHQMAAFVISMIASKHAIELAKVHKKFPDYWKSSLKKQGSYERALDGEFKEAEAC